jgi:hypothetical protein
MNVNEPKGTVSREDLDLVATFGAAMEKVCVRLGYAVLLQDAKKVQRIARVATYQANFERRKRMARACFTEEYSHSLNEEEAAEEFLNRVDEI